MNLNEYFKKFKKLKASIIVITVKDEGSKNIKNFLVKEKLGLEMNFNFRDSYVAVIDKKRKFIYEKKSKEKIECSYQVGDNSYIDIVSGGYMCGNFSSIKIGNNEFSLNRTGLNIAIFNNKTLALIDSFVCDSFNSKELLITR